MRDCRFFLLLPSCYFCCCPLSSPPNTSTHTHTHNKHNPKQKNKTRLNAAEQYVDLETLSGNSGTAAQWLAESGVVDLFVLASAASAGNGHNPMAAVVQGYARLTGTTALPQLFSLGYHQCRWNYNDEPDVAAVAAGFEAHAIPYDVLWLDIEHTDGKRYFTWDSTKFPNPVKMQDALASTGRRMVTIVDPHVKRDPSYRVHKTATELGLYVRTANNASDFDGWCWPGSSGYLDVTAARVREWWATQFSPTVYEGSTKVILFACCFCLLVFFLCVRAALSLTPKERTTTTTTQHNTPPQKNNRTNQQNFKQKRTCTSGTT